MSDAFARAAAVLHVDANLSVAAVYTPQGGASAAIRVIRWDLEREGTVGNDIIRADSATFEVLMTAVPARPATGDTIAVGDQVWAVFDSLQDIRKGVWRLSAQAA